MRYRILLAVLALLLGGSALAEPGNVIATSAAYHAGTVRGYTCANWVFLPPGNRTDYLLGVIALADTLYASNLLDYATDEAIRLPNSAVNYRSLVDAGCLIVPGSTPVVTVLYSVK